MDHATSSRLLLATHFATSLLPLTARLVPVITELGRLIVSFRRADPTPQACHRFETGLQESLRELGRIIVEWTFNHLESHDRKDMPGQIESGGTWYRRRSKTPNRSVATLFGTITLWRMLYQDVHAVEPSSAEANALVGLPGLSPGPSADRQRGDGGGVQDGVHPAAEAVGDDVESGKWPGDRRPSSDPLERGLERGVSILPGIESDTPNGDSRDYSEEEDLKCRIIAGTGAIPPVQTDVE